MNKESRVLKNNKLTIKCKIIIKEKVVKNEDEIQNKKQLFRLKQFDDLEKLLTDVDFSDVIVKVGEKIFHLHKCLLANKSTVFEAMFKNDDLKEKNKSTVEIEDIKYDILQELFRFIYTGTVKKIEDIACELLTAAEKYCVKDLKTLCEETMADNLTNHNAIEYLNSAETNNAEKLKADAIDWISLHLEDLIEKQEFDRLTKQYPELLLKITKIAINE